MSKSKIESPSATLGSDLLEISHDLKTPLHSILSSATLLKSRIQDKESQILIDLIAHKGNYLNSLINNLLDYYKILNHQISPNHLAFNLETELTELIHSHSDIDNENQFHLNWISKPASAEIYVGDPARIKQILYQLMDLMTQFCVRGKFILEAGTRVLSPKSDELCIHLHCKTEHLNDKQIVAVEEALQSEENDRSDHKHGIHFVQALSHLLDAELQLEHNAAGATFLFRIHLEKNEENKSKPINHILVVEDNLVNQRLTKVMLEQQGYHVSVADNGQEAISLFKTEHFDLILMDIQMPVMNGLEATRAIRDLEQQEQKPSVPIIALSANSRLKDKILCEQAGMNDFVNKPFRIEKFPILLKSIAPLR
jgi:CheY-like chemotaxis protein